MSIIQAIQQYIINPKKLCKNTSKTSYNVAQSLFFKLDNRKPEQEMLKHTLGKGIITMVIIYNFTVMHKIFPQIKTFIKLI